jgi:hypothetical protein
VISSNLLQIAKRRRIILSEYKQPSGWAIGWTAFSGIMMIMMGGWWLISGLVVAENRHPF